MRRPIPGVLVLATRRGVLVRRPCFGFSVFARCSLALHVPTRAPLSTLLTLARSVSFRTVFLFWLVPAHGGALSLCFVVGFRWLATLDVARAHSELRQVMCLNGFVFLHCFPVFEAWVWVLFGFSMPFLILLG